MNIVDAHPRAILLSGCLRAVFLIIWCVVVILNKVHHHSPTLLLSVALFIPTLLIVHDALGEDVHPSNAAEMASYARNHSSMLLGAVWAAGSLLAVINGTGYTLQSAKLLMGSLLVSIALVLPMPLYPTLPVSTAQRASLHVAIGMFVVGTVLGIRAPSR